MDTTWKCEIRTNSKGRQNRPWDLVWSSVCFKRSTLFHINPFYILKRADKYIFLVLTIICCAKKWIIDNCDRASTFSWLFFYIAMRIKLGCTSQFKGMGKNEWLLLCRGVFLFTVYLLHKISCLDQRKAVLQLLSTLTRKRNVLVAGRMYIWLIKLIVWDRNLLNRFPPDRMVKNSQVIKQLYKAEIKLQ